MFTRLKYILSVIVIFVTVGTPFCSSVIILHIKNSDGGNVTGPSENQNGYNGLLWKVYFVYGNKGSLISAYYLWGGCSFDKGTFIMYIPIYVPEMCDSDQATGYYIEPIDDSYLYFYFVDAHGKHEGEYAKYWISCDSLITLDKKDLNFEETIILHR